MSDPMPVVNDGWLVTTASTLNPNENHEQAGMSKYLFHVKRAPSHSRVRRDEKRFWS